MPTSDEDLVEAFMVVLPFAAMDSRAETEEGTRMFQVCGYDLTLERFAAVLRATRAAS